MSLSHVSKVYANALLELARDANSIDETEGELVSIVDAFFSDDTIRHYFLSPVVDPIQKEKTAFKAVSGKASDIVANFVTLVVRKNRFVYLPDILEDFKSGIDELKNRSSLEIHSTEALSASQKEKILKSITTRFGRDLRVKEIIDPHLIGGFKLYIGDYLIDASMRYKLKGIQESLVQKKIPVGAIYEN